MNYALLPKSLKMEPCTFHGTLKKNHAPHSLFKILQEGNVPHIQHQIKILQMCLVHPDLYVKNT